ncbi:uncharacterized protein A4U43_C02F21420 [Asparagus officinalis]|uniref:Uncharacterized protein n=1 Tax=Asparagus officinalis TaxID=4686 RepID=A0A5P1FPW2_ASPOF|nr:uncharacterized protein A4U43_C02F21420 [Asparagus officinalis]
MTTSFLVHKDILETVALANFNSTVKFPHKNKRINNKLCLKSKVLLDNHIDGYGNNLTIDRENSLGDFEAPLKLEGDINGDQDCSLQKKIVDELHNDGTFDPGSDRPNVKAEDMTENLKGISNQVGQQIEAANSKLGRMVQAQGRSFQLEEGDAALEVVLAYVDQFEPIRIKISGTSNSSRLRKRSCFKDLAKFSRS